MIFTSFVQKGLIIYCLSLSINGFAQDSLRTRKIKVLPVPALGYAPETKTYFGAVALFTINLYQDTNTRSSVAKFEVNYTQLKQLIIETEWNYFFKKEKWFTQGLLHYSIYPDLYYGIGSQTLESSKTSFQSNRFKTEMSVLKKIQENWFAGVGIRYFDYSHISTLNSPNTFTELHRNTSYGIQLNAVRDARNNILTPTKGSYFRALNNHSVSTSYYSHISVDYRKYITLGKKIKQTLSSRVYSTHVIGNAPFYDLALLGGDKLVRGYYFGRFRDKNLSTVQFEYRACLFWRIGIAAFGGLSSVYSNLNDVGVNKVKTNYGVGLRFVVDKKERTNLRFDYAIGQNGQTGFYVSFGESF